MRTKTEIQNEIRNVFAGTPALVALDIYMPAAVEGALIDVLTAITYAFELLFDKKIQEVQTEADKAEQYVYPWYAKYTLDYQHGDTLSWDNEKLRYIYGAYNNIAQIVKYVAISPSNLGGVTIKVAKDVSGSPAKLSAIERDALQGYWDKIKPVGTPLTVRSEDPDLLNFMLHIKYDAYIPINILQNNVQNAIKTYLKTLGFGGVFRISALIDAIQSVDGVIDVWHDFVEAKPNTGTYNTIVSEYTTYSGYMELDGSALSNITYTL